jgi:secretion/DNA translocation related CpaE-like protein
VFASGLALAAANRRLRVLLVDGDPLGGGIDLTLGAEDTAGLRWPDLMGTSGRVSAPTLRAALPEIKQLAVLSWDRGDLLSVPAELMRAVVTAGQRGGDLVVVDLPRRLDAAAEEALVRSTCTLLVVPAEVRAVASAARVAAQLRLVASDLRLVVRGPGLSGLDGSLIADTLSLPLAAQMRPDSSLAEALDRGFGPMRRPRGPLARACAQVLDSHRLQARAAA